MYRNTLFIITALSTLACSTKGELGEAKFQIGHNWSGGVIATGSIFSAEVRQPLFQDTNRRIRSTNEQVLQPHLGGFWAIAPGKANLLAVDDRNQMIDYLPFEVANIDTVSLGREPLPQQFAMLMETDLELPIVLSDSEGRPLLHDGLVEMLESEDRAISSVLHTDSIHLRPRHYGEERLLLRAGSIESQYRIESINPTQMNQFTIHVSHPQANHPDGNQPSSAPYGYEWTEVIIEADSNEGLPVIIPSEALYVHGARDVWRDASDVNRLWALLSWGDFPMVSLSPPEDHDNDHLQIPQHNQ